MLSYPGKLKLDRFANPSYLEAFERSAFWQAVRAAAEDAPAIDLIRAVKRLRHADQIELVRTLARANKAEATKVVLGTIAKDVVRAETFPFAQLVSLLGGLSADETTIAKLALNYASLSTDWLRAAFRSTAPMNLVLLDHILRVEAARDDVRAILLARDTQQQISANCLYWMERSLEDPDVPFDSLHSVVSAMCRSLLAPELVQPLAESWFRSLAHGVASLVKMPAPTAAQALGRVLAVYSNAYGLLKRRGVPFDAGRVDVAPEFAQLVPLAPVEDRYLFLWERVLADIETMRRLRVDLTSIARRAVFQDSPAVLGLVLQQTPPRLHVLVGESVLRAYKTTESSARLGEIAKVILDFRSMFSQESFRDTLVYLASNLSVTKLAHFLSLGETPDASVLDGLYATAVMYDRIEPIKYLFSIGFVPNLAQTIALFEDASLNVESRRELIQLAARHGAPVALVPALPDTNELEPLRAQLVSLGPSVERARSSSLDPAYAQMMQTLLQQQTPVEMSGLLPLPSKRVPGRVEPSLALVAETVRPWLAERQVFDEDKVEWASIIYRDMQGNVRELLATLPIYDARVHEPERGDLAVYDPMAEYEEARQSSSDMATCIVCGTFKRSLYSFFCDPAHAACLVCWFEHAVASDQGV